MALKVIDNIANLCEPLAIEREGTRHFLSELRVGVAGRWIIDVLRAVQFSIQSGETEDEMKVERRAPAGVFDVVASSGPEHVVGERA